MKYNEDDVVWDSYSCPLCNNKVAINRSNFERAMNDINHSSHCAYLIAKRIIN